MVVAFLACDRGLLSPIVAAERSVEGTADKEGIVDNEGPNCSNVVLWARTMVVIKDFCHRL